MADVAASIVAFIQLTGKVVSVCKYCIETIHDAPHDLRIIMVEISFLNSLLENLSFLTQQDNKNSSSTALHSLFKPDGPIDACRRAVAKLKNLLPSNTNPIANGKRQKLDLKARLAWPLHEAKAKKLLGEIVSHKSTISTAVVTDMAHDVKSLRSKIENTHSSLTEMVKELSDDAIGPCDTDIQRRTFYDWLERINPSRNHVQALALHESHTGKWMLRSAQWKRWLEGQNRFLWIHGIPGAGKTVLFSSLTEEVKRHCEKASNTAVVFYYCHYSHNQNESGSLLGWVVSQLCRQAEFVSPSLSNAFRQNHELPDPELESALASVVDRFETVYLMVDAVDESKPRDGILKLLRRLGTEACFAKIKLLVTSREYLDIEQAFKDVAEQQPMINDLVKEDIRLFAHSQLHSNDRIAWWSSTLLSEVEDALCEGAKGMFRWAVCQVEILQKLRREADVRHALKDLPETLDETYERVLFAIPKQDRDLARYAFLWLAYHSRLQDVNQPISIEVLAAAIVALDPSYSDVYEDKDLIKDVCGCLVKITENKEAYPNDDDCSCCLRLEPPKFVEFAHYTVAEFLWSDRLRDGPLSYFTISNGNIVSTVLMHVFPEALKADPHEHLTWHHDLQHYCLLTGTTALRVWGETLAADEHDTRLVTEYLQVVLENHVQETHVVDALGTWGLMIQFVTDASTSEAHVYVTLLSFHLFALAETYISDKNIKTIVTTPLKPDLGSGGFLVRGNIFATLALATDQRSIPAIEACLTQTCQVSYFPELLYAVCQTGNLCRDTGVIYGNHLKAMIGHRTESAWTGFEITPLQLAAKEGNVAIVEALIADGADPNELGVKNGKCVLLNTYQRSGENLVQDDTVGDTSALRLCTSAMQGFDARNPYGDWRGAFHAEYKAIEALLVKHGAEDFYRAAHVVAQVAPGRVLSVKELLTET